MWLRAARLLSVLFGIGFVLGRFAHNDAVASEPDALPDKPKKRQKSKPRGADEVQS
jgi:hypothetical protein